jgi:hypothetical protein
MRGSICGVTIGNGWMYNNPELVYPEGHELMSPAELRDALKRDQRDEGPIEFIVDDNDD